MGNRWCVRIICITLGILLKYTSKGELTIMKFSIMMNDFFPPKFEFKNDVVLLKRLYIKEL